MRRRRTRILQKLFINITVPLVSLCATFMLLYLLMPQQQVAPSVEAAVSVVPTQVAKPTVIPVMTAPVLLKIQDINVSAPVNPVGVTDAGDMAIDSDPAQVAWYKLGPKPGEEGSAVIAGHYGWKNGVGSVFNELNTLTKGDLISTTGEDGATKTFVVTRSAMYAPDQDATDVFRSDDGKAHLNLITCQGDWVSSAQTYTERLVVFTDLVQ